MVNCFAITLLGYVCEMYLCKDSFFPEGKYKINFLNLHLC